MKNPCGGLHLQDMLRAEACVGSPEVEEGARAPVVFRHDVGVRGRGIGEREHVARVDAEPFDFTLYVAAEGVPADAAAGVQR